MPERQKIIAVLNSFIESYEYVDESFWESFEIHDLNEQDKIEKDTAGSIADHLLNEDFIKNVENFDKKMHTQILITTPNESCEVLAEIVALNRCVSDLKLLA